MDPTHIKAHLRYIIKKLICIQFQCCPKLSRFTSASITFNITPSHGQRYSILQKKRAQNSVPMANQLAEAAYRDILGLSYARAFSAEWNTADCG